MSGAVIVSVVLLVLGGAAAVLLWSAVRRRNAHIWLPAYVASRYHHRRRAGTLARVWGRHVMFCIADHFEPGWGHADLDLQKQRVAAWLERYPTLARKFTDADGRHPRHTFFYPIEEYHPEHLQALAGLVEQGLGEVEVHYHHDNDTSDALARELEGFKNRLDGHGLLGRERGTGAMRFGFVHGNWALDNSRPDGRWCGVNDELLVLARCGCFADFTMPSAPDPTQTRTINTLYYATDDPQKPKSHDRGLPVTAGGGMVGDLLLIQGPLTINLRSRKYGVFPRIDAGEISWNHPPTRERVRLWVQQHICVRGHEEWIFVKAYTHGCQERNMAVLLGETGEVLHQALGDLDENGYRYRLHYVTAREMYNIIKAAEAGYRGSPARYRDFVIGPPPVFREHTANPSLTGVSRG